MLGSVSRFQFVFGVIVGVVVAVLMQDRPRSAEAQVPRPSLGGLQTSIDNIVSGATTVGKAAQTPWAGITGIPASLADGDQDTLYFVGEGLTQSGTTLSLSLPFTDERYLKTAGGAVAGNASFGGQVTFQGPVFAQQGIFVGNPPFSCGAGSAGLLRWTGSALQVCDGSSWRTIALQ